jgi:hypothetical protein
MKELNKIITLILISGLPFIQNCGFDIEETNAVFKWVKKGNRLTYDLNMNGTKISNYRVMDIIEDPGIRDNLIFQENVPVVQNDPYEYHLFLRIFSHVYRIKNGLHTTACATCDAQPCISVKNYLKVPLSPKKNQSIPYYLCGDQILTYDIVLSIDSVITVPLGQFRTFVINETLNQSIKFWNEEVGLIRVDNYSEYYSDTVKLELSKKNY